MPKQSAEVECRSRVQTRQVGPMVWGLVSPLVPGGQGERSARLFVRWCASLFASVSAMASEARPRRPERSRGKKRGSADRRGWAHSPFAQCACRLRAICFEEWSAGECVSRQTLRRLESDGSDGVSGESERGSEGNQGGADEGSEGVDRDGQGGGSCETAEVRPDNGKRCGLLQLQRVHHESTSASCAGASVAQSASGEVRYRVLYERRALPGGGSALLGFAFFEKRPLQGHCPLCCWLPVCDVGLPFLLHADWELVASRQARAPPSPFPLLAFAPRNGDPPSAALPSLPMFMAGDSHRLSAE